MGKKRVLLVDDERSLTQILRYALESTGTYEVRALNRAASALAAARDFHPDVILLDVMMPDLDGGTLASQLEHDADLHRVPIVFLTAIASRGEVAANHGTIGGRMFLAKPIDLQELLACLEHFTA
ncbi:MAG: response regulator [Candidatus Omnitrophica bacterium]|nr:response regulator [Candidatus Omnitrophota bacterium]